MSKEEKSQMLDKYKIAHKKMYASVKNKLKEQHLERLQKLHRLKQEEAALRNGGGSRGGGGGGGGGQEEKKETTTVETKTTVETGAGKIVVDAASAGVGSVSAESKAKMLQASQDNVPPSPSREEVLKGYKEEHRRMRAQMKAKLKKEYMDRLKKERKAKAKAMANKPTIDGEGGSTGNAK